MKPKQTVKRLRKKNGSLKDDLSRRTREKRTKASRKKPGKKIDRSAVRQLDILENIDTSYFELDLKGNLTYFNDIVCRHLGYKREELTGKNFAEFTKPECREAVRSAYMEVYRTGRPKTIINVELIQKNGTINFVEQSVALMKDPSGRTVGFQGVAKNVTERIMAEQALKKSEEKYRTVLEEIGEAFYESDLRGNLTFVNEIGRKFLGVERGDETGLNYKQLYLPEATDRIKEMYKTIYETGKPLLLLDYEVKQKDGSIRYHQMNATLMRDASGRPAGFRTLVRDITERKQVEEALKISEERYRTLLEDMGEGFFECDLRGNLTFVNETGRRFLDFVKGELIGSNYTNFFPSENVMRIRELYENVYKTGKPVLLHDYQVKQKDGSFGYRQMSVTLLRDGSGKPMGFRTLVRDITERKQAEEALRKSEEKYRTILESMEELYVESDLRGNYTFANDATCRLMGCTSDDFLKLNYRQVFAPKTIQYLNEVYSRIFNTGKPEFLIEYDGFCKDGSIVKLEANVSLLRDAAGAPTGFRTMARDITERKKAEESLRKSEEKYRTILETMGEGYFEADLRGTITFANNAGSRQLGFDSPDELAGRNFKKNHPPETYQRLYEAYSRVYRTGVPEFLMDYEVLCKDGSIRIHEANVALMHDESGKPSGFSILARDVTERKRVEEEKARIEEQFIQAQKMESVGRLAGGVAHDFNNMLAVILGYAELIKSRLPRGDPLLNEILEIEKAAARSRDMTRQLLAFSRKEIIAPKTLDLNCLIENMHKTLLRLIGEDIDLKLYPREGLWSVKVDPSQIEHILVNLSVNARDAMPDGGKLTIETENVHLDEEYCKKHHQFAPGNYVMLGVSDDGMGMDRETRSHLFEPFFTTKEKGRGTGLGLATVYGIVRQNEGFINVYSEPGKGTTFRIYIPGSPDEAVTEDTEKQVGPVHDTGTILLVEDDDMVRIMTTEMLESIGYTVVSARSPAEALSFFEKEGSRVDLVITDVVMPQMNGRELGERIAAKRPGTRILFMSGYTTNVIAHRGVLDEGVYFIQKPFSMSDLANKVREAISGR